jgi:hypothetical protein
VLANDASIRGFKLGTHTLRKMAYLFAVFGIMLRYKVTGRRKTSGEYPLPVTAIQTLEDDALAKVGQHAAISNASLYYMGCLQQWHTSGVHKVHVWRDNKVSEWKLIYFSVQQCPPNMDALSQTSKSLADLATWYVSEELKIIPTHNDYHRALKVACDRRSSQSSCEEELKNILQALPASLVGKANKYLRLTLDKVYKEALNSIGASTTRIASSAIVIHTNTTSTTATALNGPAGDTEVASEVSESAGAGSLLPARPRMEQCVTPTTPAMAATTEVPTTAGMPSDASSPDPLDLDKQKKERCKRKQKQREGDNPGNFDEQKKAMEDCRAKRDRRELYRLCQAASTFVPG